MIAAGVRPNPASLVFKQIDVDHSGRVSVQELRRLVRATTLDDDETAVETKADGLFAALDKDENGDISLEEWSDGMKNFPDLRSEVMGVMDPATGFIKSFRSKAEQLAELLFEKSELEDASDSSGRLDACKAQIQAFRDA